LSLATPKLGQNVISLSRYRLIGFRHCQWVTVLDGTQNFSVTSRTSKTYIDILFWNSGSWGIRQVSKIQRCGLFWKSRPWLNLLIFKVFVNSKWNTTLPDLTAIQQCYIFLQNPLCFNKVLSIQACRH